jgi:CheY-like chemotaxis protein
MNETDTTTAGPGVVLIADDNPEARRMLDVRVKREGHQTILDSPGGPEQTVLVRQRNKVPIE